MANATLSALGEEAIIPKTQSRGFGLFLVESTSWRDFQFELGARGGNAKRNPDSTDANRSFSLASFAAGSVWNFTPGYALALNASSSQRAPTIEELYSDGAHVATATFEIGNASLAKEKSRNLDLGLRKTTGAWTGKIGGFANHIRNYIYGAFVDSNGDGIADRVDDTGALDPNGDFTVINYAQSTARFVGLEGEVNWRPDPAAGLGLRAFGDMVRGKLMGGGGDLPRMSPARVGLEADYKLGPWTASSMLMHVFRQDRVAPLETTTDGYTRLDGSIEYTMKAGAEITTKLYLRGFNLLNQDMRIHTSYIKDFAPMQGRSLIAGLRLNF